MKSKFSNFITHKLWEHLVGVFNTIHIQSLFNDYHVTTLKIIHPITFQNYTKHSIKVLGNKNNMYMQPFSKTFPTIHLNIFVPNAFNKRNLPEIQDKNILYLALIMWRRVFLQKKKNAVRWIIKQNCEQNLVKHETKNCAKRN